MHTSPPCVQKVCRIEVGRIEHQMTHAAVGSDVPALPINGWYQVGAGYDNPCLCSSVLYSVMSACTICQDGLPLAYVLLPWSPGYMSEKLLWQMVQLDNKLHVSG